MNNILNEIENNFEVEKIKVNGIQVWPFLRISYRGLNHSKLNIDKKSSVFKKLFRIKNMFFGIRNLRKLKKYKYLLITDTLERRKIDNTYKDKISESLIDVLKDTILVLEEPISSHYKMNSYSYKEIISYDFILFYSKIIGLFVKNKNEINIENENILKEINNRYNTNIDYYSIISKFFVYYNIFDKFFKRYSFEIIFVNCYYSLSNIAFIFVANKNNIRTVELQHGVINKSHEAYNIYYELINKLDNNFFPNYLLGFGEYIKNELNYIPKNKIISVGNYYIEYINNSYTPDKKVVTLFSKLRERYKKIVVVASQYTVTKKLFDFIKKSADLNNDIVYLIFPRNEQYIHPYVENIKIFDNVNYIDIYQAIKFSDIHTTVYSSTALEAPILGTPNILINIDGYADKFYKSILPDSSSKLVNRVEEFIELILKDNWDLEKVKTSHEKFYISNHSDKIRNFLKGVIKNEKSDK